MTDRILDFSENPARLSVRNANLVIKTGRPGPASTADNADSPAGPEDAGREVLVPFTDIAVVVVSHPQVNFSHAVLSGLAAAGAMLVTCDEKRLPAAMLLPLQSHTTQTERFAAQSRAPLPIKKRLWRRVVRAKLRSQAALLEAFGVPGGGLRALLPDVKSGDKGNVEAQGARRYWSALVNAGLLPENFTREPEGDWPNALFNYGYAVLRAIVARALCARGLHPSLGLHHHNRYNAFCLADDLMEPFRPLVDHAVLSFTRAHPEVSDLGREGRQAMIGALLERQIHHGESRSIFDIMARVASVLAAVLAAEKPVTKFRLPELVYAGA